MKTTTARAGAAMLAGVMALSCASCGLLPTGGAKKEDIIDAADDFAKALVSCDTDKIAKLTNEEKDSDTIEELEANLNGLLYSVEQDQIAEAVADTIEYEIDEDSVEIKKDEASVDVVFTMVDYEEALGDGEFASVDEALDAIKDCDDTCEVEISFEFEKDDDEWLISNLGDKSYGKFYSFYGVDVSFTPDLASLVDYTSIYGDYNYIYMTVTFTEDVSAYADGFTFDVYLDGVLYGTQIPEVDEKYIWCDLTLDGPLDSGSYTFKVMYGDDEVASDSVDIDNTSGSGSVSGEIPDIDGDVYLCYTDCAAAFIENMQNDGFDLDFEGQLGIWFELTISDDGEYVLKVDGDTFNADLIDFFTDNKDQLMMGFLGVSSEDDLEAYAESLGDDSYLLLEQTIVQTMVSEYSAEYSELCDYGTYTVTGDYIYFSSYDYSGFDGTIGDDMILINTGSETLNDGEPLEFYPEG